MLDLKPKWYPSIPLEVALIWHTHELTAVEAGDPDCVSDLLAPGLVNPFLCALNFPSVSFSIEKEGKKEQSYDFCLSLCDLDGFIERCDMFKMELR